MKARIPPAAIGALVALAVGPAAAHGGGLKNAPVPPTVSLPAQAGAMVARAHPAGWIVGVRAGGGALARAHGASRIAARTWLAPRSRTRALARALRARDLLDYAEPDRLARLAQAPAPDPLSPLATWRDTVVGAAVAPAVGPDSPLIGMVDTLIDVRHPEIAGSNITTSGGTALRDEHGTATSTVAAAPANGVGFLGVWPGARVLNLPLPSGVNIKCSDRVRAIAGAVAAGAAVINMSYGALVKCYAEEQQLLRAVKQGAVAVAAAGNEFMRGNPDEFPASLPHVITVAATRRNDKPAYFSNDNLAVDLSAPGVGVLTAVPQAWDPDDVNDGYSLLDGTSFSAPMVSAAVAWVRAARPELTPFQAAQAVRVGARDVWSRGYDSSTGFGVLSLPRALALPAPADDPLEPNDDIRYVDGRAFGTATPPLYSGAPASIAALVDLAEDPADVYRVDIPPGGRVRLSLVPRFGDPDLFLFDGGARSVLKARSLRNSSRTGGATDRLSVGNRGRGTRRLYAVVGFNRKKKPRLLDAGYELSAR